ncbi:unnamed protein product [Brassica oleracea]
MVSKISGGGVPLVSIGDSSFVYRRLLCAVHFRSLISAFCSFVEWDTKLLVCVSLELRTIALADDVLMDLTSVGSTIVLFGGPFVASVRSLTVVCSSLTVVCSFTVVCSPLSVFILAFGAVYLYFSFWWQLKEKFIGKVCWMNMIMAGSIRLSHVWSSLFSQYFFMYGVNWMNKRRWYCKDLPPRECSTLCVCCIKYMRNVMTYMSGPWSTGHVVPGCVDQHKHNISTPIEITNTRLVENI